MEQKNMSHETKREFLMLAHKYKPAKHDISGHWFSEKLDGMRCYWDGGINRGVPKINIIWANHEGDERYKEPPIATGLWSRYGNIIHAPDEWLDQLPPIPLDGELYVPGFRQHLMSTVKKLTPDVQDWDRVLYYAFDTPPYGTIFDDGRIYSPNYKKVFQDVGVPDLNDILYHPRMTTSFRLRYLELDKWCNDRVICHKQVQLPFEPVAARKMAEEMVIDIVAKGGEGGMVRSPDAWYKCKRVHDLLKMKPEDDAEGMVVGYTSGRKTALGSKHLGRMGALILHLDNGKRMELSGFTDAEREFSDSACTNFATMHPGVDMPEWITNSTFPIGSEVSFKYRGKTADGIPAEARYWRKR